MKPLLATLAALALALAASGCSGDGAAIPDAYGTSDAAYTLLYSTLGYDSAATKHLIIRQNETGDEIAQGLAFQWRVFDGGGREHAAGLARYQGTAWGIPVWVADFSEVREPGEYRITVEAPDVRLATQPFPIDRMLFFKSTFSMLALENAEARAAPIELDNGYFDANSLTGSTGAHGDFLVGLVETYTRRRVAFSAAQRLRLQAAIDRAVDYLLLVSDPGSGEFFANSPTRPFSAGGAEHGLAAVRGLARYAATFQLEDADGAERAFRRAVRGAEWLTANAPQAYTPAWRATVDYDLYRFSGNAVFLDAAVEAVREQASTYDLRTMDRSGADQLPHFEGMYRMWRDLGSHPDRQLWEDTAARVALQYLDMLARNPFGLVPSGITEPGKPSAVEQWDQVATLPAPGQGSDDTIPNDWYIARAVDAVYLADMLKDPSLEQSATASLGWITGLNPGIPVARVPGSSHVSRVEGAAFMTGLEGRAVQGTPAWEWTRTRPFATIVNGYWGGFFFDDSPLPAASSIKHDGTWLYAIAAYEDYLHPGARAPDPDPSLDATGMRVSAVEPSRSEGVLRATVSITDPAGAPLAGALVTGAWGGVRAPGASPEDLVTAGTCVTDAGGSCQLAQPVAELATAPPHTFAVTNVEHPAYTYDIEPDGAEPGRGVEFP